MMPRQQLLAQFSTNMNITFIFTVGCVVNQKCNTFLSVLSVRAFEQCHKPEAGSSIWVSADLSGWFIWQFSTSPHIFLIDLLCVVGKSA